MGRVDVYREQFELLAGPFRKWPDLPCLICNRGALEPTITEFESKISADHRVGAETLEGPERGFFHGELACSRVPCGNRYVVAGEWTRGSSNPDENDLDTYDPDSFGTVVRHILPPLPLIAFPDATPPKVAALVESASSVLLSDPAAATTRIRTAIEVLLDEQRIRKTTINKRGVRVRLFAHDRIKLLESKNKEASDQLMAMKNIGNVGTHEGEPLPLAWVLDGIELFARAIELIYDRREAELARRAAEINRRGRNLRATPRPSSAQVNR